MDLLLANASMSRKLVDVMRGSIDIVPKEEIAEEKAFVLKLGQMIFTCLPSEIENLTHFSTATVLDLYPLNLEMVN